MRDFIFPSSWSTDDKLVHSFFDDSLQWGYACKIICQQIHFSTIIFLFFLSDACAFPVLVSNSRLLPPPPPTNSMPFWRKIKGEFDAFWKKPGKGDTIFLSLKFFPFCYKHAVSVSLNDTLKLTFSKNGACDTCFSYLSYLILQHEVIYSVCGHNRENSCAESHDFRPLSKTCFENAVTI